MKKLRFLVFAVIITCFLALITGCGKPALSKPANLKIDEATLTLTWRQVVGARRYTVSVNGEERDSRTNSYSLENLEAGEYRIRVKARANEEENRDSGWSDRISFTREAEPGLTFQLRNKTEYDVTGPGMLEGNIVIPETYRGKPVTGIGDRAFSNKSAITSVTLGSNVTRIGTQAFSNCSLQTIVFSEGLTSIGANAFMSCRNLEGNITIPKSVTELGEGAFSYCRKLTGVTLGENLKTIPKNAFADCSSLLAIEIPNGVQRIADYAFTGCSAATKLELGNGVTAVGANAFYGCAKLTELELPASVTSVGEAAFANCSALVRAEIPDQVASLGSFAFDGCKALAEVSLGNGILSIGELAFRGTALWNDETGKFVYAGNWLVGCKDAEIYSFSEYDFRAGTIGIAANVFEGFSKLAYVTLPESVKYINEAAFYNVPNLYWVILGKGVTEIGANAFNSCKALGVVVLGSDNPQTTDSYDYAESSLQTIGAYAFRNCSSLNNIKIPDTVTTIDAYAFNGSGMWKNASSSDKYVVYADNWAVGFHQELNLGEQYSFRMREGTVGISNYAFYKNRNFQVVEVPETVKTIGRGAFYGNANLIGVTLPDSLTEIQDYTFYNCPVFVLGALPKSLEKIGRSAFYGCKLLGAQNGDDDMKNITFSVPDGVTEIGDFAFYGCGDNVEVEGEIVDYRGIETLIIGSGVQKIGANAFANFVSLKTVVIPDSVTELGERAFYNCERLETVTLGNGITSISDRAFYGCKSLKKIELPAGITSIGNYAFYNCNALEEVGFGESVAAIGDYAFYGAAFKSLHLPASVQAIGKQAFRNCKLLTEVVLDGVKEIDMHAFYGCNELTVYTTATSAPEGWNARWNSSYRPVIWGVALAEDGSVSSFTKTNGGVSNLFEKNLVSAPVRAGYGFAGWARTQNAAGAEWSANEIGKIPAGTAVYAVWQKTAEVEPETDASENV